MTSTEHDPTAYQRDDAAEYLHDLRGDAPDYSGEAIDVRIVASPPETARQASEARITNVRAVPGQVVRILPAQRNRTRVLIGYDPAQQIGANEHAILTDDQPGAVFPFGGWPLMDNVQGGVPVSNRPLLELYHTGALYLYQIQQSTRGSVVLWVLAEYREDTAV